MPGILTRIHQNFGGNQSWKWGIPLGLSCVAIIIIGLLVLIVIELLKGSIIITNVST